MASDYSAASRSLFPYPTVRPAQDDGIDAVIDAVSNDGFVLCEGECGTGKTVLALAGLLPAVRDSDSPYDRIVVATNVKQQQRAFEDTVTDINANLPPGEAPVTALTLTGKGDVYPYVVNDTFYPSEVYTESERLRENTRDIIDHTASAGLEGRRDAARRLYRSALVDGGSDEGAYPYGDAIPTFDADDGAMEFDPFYARHLTALYNDELDNPGPDPEAVVPFSPGSTGVLTSTRLIDLAARREGTSPHGVMGQLLTNVDVVIANYSHLFDPKTVDQFSSGLIDDSSLLVIDEAHNLPTRVPDLLSTRAPFQSLPAAATELDEVESWLVDSATQTPEAMETVRDVLKDVDVDSDQLAETATLLRAFHEKLGDRAVPFLREELGHSWLDNPSYDEDESFGLPLRKPGSAGKDILSEWLEFSPAHDRQTAVEAADVMAAAHEIRAAVYENHYGYSVLTDTALQSVGDVISKWVTADNVVFFRELTFEPRHDGVRDPSYAWENHFRAYLSLRNCLPRDAIADCVEEFGAGILMSATLEPLDIIEELVGLDALRKRGRYVDQLQFGLPFPEENRFSFATGTHTFRYADRGPARDDYGGPSLDTPAREEFFDVIYNVVEETPGNVLVVLPSYGEAAWAGRLLKTDSSVSATDILIDESSSNQETEELKQKFFTGGKKVLVTAAYGTLIEGVDYAGEKLEAVVACGVPLMNPNVPYHQAMLTAYHDAFNNPASDEDNAFDYAFMLPAVHKVRQALGRVIRSETDVGVRVLLDSRYTETAADDTAREFMPASVREEFNTVEPDSVGNRVAAFWRYQQNTE